jgi:hypothetical protein
MLLEIHTHQAILAEDVSVMDMLRLGACEIW